MSAVMSSSSLPRVVTSYSTLIISVSTTSNSSNSASPPVTRTTASVWPSGSGPLPFPACAISCVNSFLPLCVNQGLSCICPLNTMATVSQRTWALGAGSGPQYGECLFDSCNSGEASYVNSVLTSYCGPHPEGPGFTGYSGYSTNPPAVAASITAASSTAAPSSSSSSAAGSGGGLSTGAAAGIGIGVAIVVLMLAGIFILLQRRRQAAKSSAADDEGKSDGSVSSQPSPMPPMSMAAKVADYGTRPPTASTTANANAFHEVQGDNHAAKELPSLPHRHLNANSPTELPAEPDAHALSHAHDYLPPAYALTPVEMSSQGSDKVELPVTALSPVSPEEKWEQPPSR